VREISQTGHELTSAVRQIRSLLDHLDDDGDQRGRNFKAERSIKNRRFTLNLANSALAYLRGKLAGKADAGFTLPRTTLNSILTRRMTFPNAIRAGDIKVEGEVGKLGELIGVLDEIAADFPIVEPVRANHSRRATDPSLFLLVAGANERR